MAIICTWSGDNATPGPVTNGTAGDGDTELTHVNGTLTVTTDGTRPNRIQLANSGVARCGWWQFPGYPLTTLAARLYLNRAGNPGTTIGIIRFISSSGVQGTVGLSNNGMLTIRDDAAAVLRYTGTSALPLNEDVRIEATLTGGTLTTTAYQGDTSTVIDTGTATVGTGAINEVWYGRCDNTTGADWHIDDLALADTADLIGPAAEPPAPASPFRIWNGTNYQHADAHTWDGTGYVPVTSA